MIRVHGLSHDQFIALMRLAEDNQSFETADRPPHLTIIEGGRRESPNSCLRQGCDVAKELCVVGY